jgi:VWFA-related protein
MRILGLIAVLVLTLLWPTPAVQAQQSASPGPPLPTPSSQSPAAQSAPAQSAPATPPQPEGFSAETISAPGGPGTPTFKTTTRLVVVDVVVTAKNGAPVHGLKQSDFRVFENGQEQSIKVFEERKNDMLPVISPPNPIQLLPAGEATNAGHDVPTTALSVILFDALNTASSDQSFARDQVKKVIASLPPGSRIAIFTLRGSLHMIQGFTTDTTVLAAAMNKDKSTINGPWFNDPDMVLLSSGADPAGYAANPNTSSAAGDVLSGNGSPTDNMGPATYLGSVGARDEVGLTSQLRTARTFAAIQGLVRYLSALPGRKNLFWLSGVFPFDILPDTSGTSTTPDPFRGINSYGNAVYALAEQMEAGHIAVYPVDVRGLVPGGFNGATSGSAMPSAASIGNAANADLGQFETMENLAHQTGGRAIYNDNDIKGEITESLNQGANYYTLAYSPTNHDWNGKYRKIEVRSDLKNVSFYYRRGYLAVDPDKSSSAIVSESIPKFSVAMLHGAPERADIVMTVKTTPTGKYVDEKDRPAAALLDRNAPPPPPNKAGLPFEVHLKGTTEIYAIDCTIDAKSVKFSASKDGKFIPQLALTFIAYDADGKLLNAQIGAFTIPLTAAQVQAVTQHGLTITNKMELPLGRIFLRVGVHDLSDDKVGATELPLVVTHNSQTASK